MYRHGESHTRLYAIWKSMRQRCQNEHHHAYENYGGRGIKVCREWQVYESFRSWAMSTGYNESAPRGALTLDRINNDGNYEPSNCKWSDMTQQANNRRKYPRHNRRIVSQIDADGSAIATYPSIASASKATGIPWESIRDACSGRIKTARGTVWRYADEDSLVRSQQITVAKERVCGTQDYASVTLEEVKDEV